MNDGFFKFPSTPHLLQPIGGVEIRGDKVMSDSERDEFLRRELVIEEKLDGANLGLSFDSEGNIRAQNRGGYLRLPSTGQWKRLSEWLTPRTDQLFEQLADQHILFGEWCYAQHSVAYDALPDWLLGFDIYDRASGRFLSCTRRDQALAAMSIAQAPRVSRGHFTLSELNGLLAQSQFGSGPAEGLYLRCDQGDWLFQRAKLVRPAFIQSVEQHWARSSIRANQLGPGTRA